MTREDFIADLRADYLRRGFAEAEAQELSLPVGNQVEPDLVFRNVDGEVVVLQVKRQDKPVDPKVIAQAYETLERRPGWTFRFLITPDRPPRLAVEEDASRAPGWARQADEAARAGNVGLAAILVSMALEISLRALAGHARTSGETNRPVMETARRLRDDGKLDDDDLATIYDVLKVRDTAIHGYEITNALPTLKEALVLADDVLIASGIAPAPASDGFHR